MQLVVRSLLLAIAASPLAAQTNLALLPERPVTATTFEEAAGRQDQPSVATDGHGFAVVWVDSRPTPGGAVIRLARVAPTGEVLDPFGLVVRGSNQPVLRTEIFWTGAHYVAVWLAGNSLESYEVWAARFSPDGTFVDESARRISNSPLSGPAAVASNGETVLFAAAGSRALLFSADLTLRRQITLSRAAPDAILTTAAGAGSNGRDYLLVWAERRQQNAPTLWAIRIEADGDLDSAGIMFVEYGSANDGVIEVAGNNFGYLVTWAEQLGVYADFTLPNGDSRASFRFSIAAASAIGNVVWMGDGYMLPTWPHLSGSGPEDLSVVHVRLRNDLRPITVSAAPGLQVHGSIAWGGSRALVVWTDSRRDEPDIYAAFVDRTPSVVPLANGLREFPLTYSTPWQENADVVFDGESYFAVWSQPVGAGSRVFAGPVSGTGEPLAPAVPMPDSTSSQIEPAIAFNGNHYVAIWAELPPGVDPSYPVPLVGARIGRDGRVLDQNAWKISDEVIPGDYAIASDGSESLVAFGRNVRFRTDTIHLAKIRRGGQVIQLRTVPLASGTETASSPSLAFGSGNYLLVWNDRLSVEFICQITCPPINDPNVMAVRVRPDGSIIDEPIAIAISNKVLELRPKVTWGDSMFLVVWGVFEDFFGGTGGFSERAMVHAKRVDANGRPIDPEPIVVVGPTPAEGPESKWELAHDGVTFIVVAGMGRLSTPLVAVRITDRGRALDVAGGLLVSPDAQLGAVVSRGRGESLIVYNRLIDDPSVGTDRLLGRVLRQPESDRRRSAR